MDKPNNTPPPWSDAPPWAKYRAQDENGLWWGYSVEPEQNVELGYWIVNRGEEGMVLKTGEPNPNWKTTLQKRPDNE